VTQKGRPLAIEAIAGNLNDHITLPAHVQKLKQRFGLKSVIVVSDRGMATRANLEAMGEAEGVGWITALNAPAVRKLVKDGDLQLSLCSVRPTWPRSARKPTPAERLILCRNPLLAEERSGK
jgi:hypothetical protein